MVFCQRLRDQYETQVRRGQPSHLAKFSFAHGLIKSTKNDVHQGIAILERMFTLEILSLLFWFCPYFG